LTIGIISGGVWAKVGSFELGSKKETWALITLVLLILPDHKG
jgi:ABC-type transport system involved in cytochrome c biogenesis permease subunit